MRLLSFLNRKRSFADACVRNRKAIYGIIGSSRVGNQINFSNGTAFMIAPGILVTAAHLTHRENNPSLPVHQNFELIRTPDIAQSMENAQFIAEDPAADIALFRIDRPRSSHSLALKQDAVPIGTCCGSLGFPLAEVTFGQGRRMFNLVERFQGANISSYSQGVIDQVGRQMPVYETDSLMYKGSSGCPGFTEDGVVFGMHVKSRVDRPRGTPGAQQGAANPAETRLAISLWVSSTEIIAFARQQGIAI